jgi:hypothetical protein
MNNEERKHLRWIMLVSVVWALAAGVVRAQENKPAENAAAKEPPANQWVKIGEVPRVANVSLVYAPSVRRFVMVKPDGVLHFDLESRVWKSSPVKGKWPNARRGVYFQATWDPGSKKILSYLNNRTASLDPDRWVVTDHKASPSPAAGPRDLVRGGGTLDLLRRPQSFDLGFHVRGPGQ